MSNYYLCRTRRTRHPFYIESIGRNIYSIEELCYFLYQYVYLVDDTILNEKLCVWIGEELGLLRLAKSLMRVLERQLAESDVSMPVFKECGYLPDEELLYYQEQLADIQIEPEAVRKKMKADHLVEFGVYAKAIGEYEKILEQPYRERQGIQFYAAVLEKMATAYALFMPEEEYQKRLAELKANRDEAQELWRRTYALIGAGKESASDGKWKDVSMDEQIEMLKKDYIRGTKYLSPLGK